jgi:hypothetical protein
MKSLLQWRTEADQHRTKFLSLHRLACLELGAYARAMGSVQAKTTELAKHFAQHGLAGNAEADNHLRKLLFTEQPIRTLMNDGLEVPKGWGFDLRCEVVPLVPRYPISQPEEEE